VIHQDRGVEDCQSKFRDSSSSSQPSYTHRRFSTTIKPNLFPSQSNANKRIANLALLSTIISGYSLYNNVIRINASVLSTWNMKLVRPALERESGQSLYQPIV